MLSMRLGSGDSAFQGSRCSRVEWRGIVTDKREMYMEISNFWGKF